MQRLDGQRDRGGVKSLGKTFFGQPQHVFGLDARGDFAFQLRIRGFQLGSPLAHQGVEFGQLGLHLAVQMPFFRERMGQLQRLDVVERFLEHHQIGREWPSL